MSKSVQILTHSQRVGLLYKTILKLHRGLPSELKALGDQYVKHEFQRHKDIDEKQTYAFMIEWTDYAMKLAQQLGLKGFHNSKPIGASLSQSDLDKFSEQQIYQLYELYKETSGCGFNDRNDSES